MGSEGAVPLQPRVNTIAVAQRWPRRVDWQGPRRRVGCVTGWADAPIETARPHLEEDAWREVHSDAIPTPAREDSCAHLRPPGLVDPKSLDSVLPVLPFLGKR